MKTIKSRILINCFWGLVLFWISFTMPFTSDDYWHMTSFATGGDITSLSMILPSALGYYNSWGGRILSMILIQSMLYLPHIVFSVCNAAVFVILANILSSFVLVESRDRDLLLSVIYLFLWFFMPDFSEVMTWTTGAVTYLWTNTIVAAFGLLYFRGTDSNDNALMQILKTVGYAALGFCAGLSNEAAACTLILGLAMYLVYSFRSKRHIAVYRWAGIISCIAGTFVLLLAPGNRIRMAASDGTKGALIKQLAVRITRETFYALMFLLIPVVISILLFMIRRVISGTATDISRKESVMQALWKLFGIKEVLFWFFAFVGIYIMTFSAGFANRIYQFSLILITLSAVTSISGILQSISDTEKHEKLRRTLALACALLMLMALVEIVAGMLYSAQVGTYFDRQMMYYHVKDSTSMGLIG